MTIYQNNIPTGLVKLNIDYANIRNNFQQLDTSFGQDHVAFSSGTAQNGFHEDIHFNPFSTTTTNPTNNYVSADQYPNASSAPPATQSGIPPVVAGIGQLWSAQVNDSINTDTGLYWLSGNGLKVAMTRNFSPRRAANGYTFLPGGLMMQWGVYVRPGGGWPAGNQTITFATANIAFSNACFTINTTFTGASGSQGSIGIVSESATNFVWNFGGSANSGFTGFYWTAIGY